MPDLTKSSSTPTLFDLGKHVTPRTPKYLSDGGKASILGLLKLGMNKEFVAMLLALAEYKLAHVRYLAGPIVVHRSGWLDTIPSWLIEAIPAARAEAIFAESDARFVGELATAEEILACLYPATMEAPITYRWYRVYMYVGNIVLTKHQKLKEQTFWEFIGLEHPISYDEVKRDYEELAQDIRRKVVKAAAGRGVTASKSSKQREHNTSLPATPPPDKNEQQLSIFGLL